MIKTHLVKKDVHVNITECTQLIVPFAETLINIENNLTICLKNEIKNGTHYRNSIDDAVEHTLDILKGIKNKALFCPQGIEYNSAGLQCAVQVSSLNRIDNTNIPQRFILIKNTILPLGYGRSACD